MTETSQSGKVWLLLSCRFSFLRSNEKASRWWLAFCVAAYSW